MRTTITLDPDVDALVRRRMAEGGRSFKETVNDVLRGALTPEPAEHYHLPTFHLGWNPDIDLDKALQLAGELEDQEILAKMRLGR